jgi:hypothetical protein
MTVQADLLIEIEAFLAARRGQPDGMAETTFGRLAVNDGKFVRRLRDGCNMTLATIDRVRQFIRIQQNTLPPAANDPPAAANDTPKPKRPPRSAGAAATPSAVEKAA